MEKSSGKNSIRESLLPLALLATMAGCVKTSDNIAAAFQALPRNDINKTIQNRPESKHSKNISQVNYITVDSMMHEAILYTMKYEKGNHGDSMPDGGNLSPGGAFFREVIINGWLDSTDLKNYIMDHNDITLTKKLFDRTDESRTEVQQRNDLNAWKGIKSKFHNPDLFVDWDPICSMIQEKRNGVE